MKNTQGQIKDDSHPSVFPGMEPLNLPDTKEAIKLGWLNFDNVKPEYQPELRRRLKALATHSRDLIERGR